MSVRTALRSACRAHFCRITSRYSDRNDFLGKEGEVVEFVGDMGIRRRYRDATKKPGESAKRKAVFRLRVEEFAKVRHAPPLI
jgi:hypothetical protein